MSMLAEFEAVWFTHPILLKGREVRTAKGVTYGADTQVMASVDATTRTVTNTLGEEQLVSATLCWAADGPLPPINSQVTLPAMFGIKPDRKVVTARRAISGNGLTPDHVEVTIV